MPSLSYQQYKGKNILYIDFRNKKRNQNIATIYDAAKEVRAWTEKGLILPDFRNAITTPEFLTYAKQLGLEVFAPKSLKSACIGITGAKKKLLQEYNTFCSRSVVSFETEEEAKEWLIRD
jgi:hypothetical protein